MPKLPKLVKSAAGVRTVMARLTSGVEGGMNATTRCKPAALLNRCFGSEAAAPPRAPPVASCHPAGTVNENPSKVSVYTEGEVEDEVVLVEVAILSSAAKEGSASRAAVAAARLPRAVRRDDDGSGALETTTLPAD